MELDVNSANSSVSFDASTASLTMKAKQTVVSGSAANANTVNGVDDSALSGVAAFAFSYDLSELEINSSSTSFTYRNDASLALRATSKTDIRMKVETFTADITLTAESVGLTAEDFAGSDQPLSFTLSLSSQQMNITQRLNANHVKLLRKPEEIMMDLVKGVSKVMSQKGNHTIRYEMDAEAIQALMQSDPGMLKTFREIVMILNAINLMKQMQGADESEVIQLSGNGNTYWDVEKQTTGEVMESRYEFNITILPPGRTATDQASVLPSTSPVEA